MKQKGYIRDSSEKENTITSSFIEFPEGEVNCPVSQNIKTLLENELIFQSAPLGCLARGRRTLDSYSLL